LTVDAMGWWASRRDTASIRAAESAAAARARAGGTQASLATYEALVAAAHLALARGDSADAIRRFDALPRDGCPLCLSVQLVHARLLSLRGADARAREILRRRVTLLPSAFDVLFALERARAAARAGDAAEAAAAYGLVARAWARGDPQLASLVAEARQGVGRVGPSTRARAR
jgi:eukaryotic-like serine/threonine-protein kinase